MGKTNVKKSGLADQATNRLRAYIINNKFKPGDLLPGEIELAHELGVSRTIIREALSRFRMLGIVESRRRRGMVLRSPDILNGIELALNANWLNADAMREMFELRLMLEIGMADFLFRHKDEKLLKKLEKIILREKEATNEAERMKADADFHASLYAATNNHTLLRFQKLLYPLFEEYAAEEVKSSTRPIVDHDRLLHELRTGSVATFRVAMRHHIDPHFKN